MKILVLAPFLPFPLDQGGKIRIFNILQHLAQSHSVTLAATLDDKAVAAEAGPLRELCDEVLLFERPAKLWPDRFAFFTQSSPYNVIRFRCEEMRKALKELHRQRRYDVVLVEFSLMWQYADIFTSCPVVLDAHNIEYKNVEQIGMSTSGLFWKAMYHIEKKRLRAIEERAWRECSLCFTVSNKEQGEISAFLGGNDKVITAANGVDLDRFSFQPHREDKKILFLGGMDYAPNLDAARYFLGEILPLIQEREPDVKVLLVGRELHRLGTLSTLPGVECHESVPDVLPWFYEAKVLAVPLRIGAGTRIKVLEAMAAGLPVVATPKGYEGIAARDGFEVLEAVAPANFAASVVKILNDPILSEQLAVNAQQLVAERYTWRAAADIISKACENISNRG
ncbi:glycosyltransferase family 4 protein [Geomonas oryzae]|uniref:glycosyltransferase family 4 protein n=1 Tax=Geomonas oryzae TaxID=2364273 RepID=UPI0013A5C87E|nr:glycosyltransferase family 4 protein [Geomonas oryzae]